MINGRAVGDGWEWTEPVGQELVANVSHELRRSVASLKAVVETLEAGALGDPEAARYFLGRMRIEVDGLDQLVEELLARSSRESGRATLCMRPAHLGPVVAAVAERLRPLAERQGVVLVVCLPGDLPAMHFDPERIQQVVANLIHNAVKFTRPGGRVRVSAEWLGDEVAVVIADTGVGIAAEALPRLFDRFYRAGGSGGSGLGLAIAKHLVQAHAGRIWAESAGDGQGATFTFTVPLRRASTSA